MKKFLFVMSLVALAGTSMAQNSAINRARRMFDDAAKQVQHRQNNITTTTVEIDWDKTREAQELLTPVFDNPKTRDFVGAWRLQGDINNRYLSNEVNKAAASQPLDTMFFYNMLNGTLDAYYKVVELDNGGVQKGLVQPYFQSYRTYFYYAGAFFDQNGERAMAYEAFMRWLNYPQIYSNVDETILANSAGNIDPNQVAFYASLSAYNAHMYDEVLALKEMSYLYPEQADIARSLVLASYQAKGDTLAWANESRELILSGTAPEGTMQNLLQYYWISGQKENLRELATMVCEQMPNEQWGPYAMGIVAQDEQNWVECERWFRQAVEINPEFTEALKGVGLALYQRALELYAELPTTFRSEAERDNAEQPVKDLCQQAASYFEQVREQIPDRVNQWVYNLMQIYSILGENEKVQELRALAGDDNE